MKRNYVLFVMFIMAATAMAHTVVNSSHRHNKKTEPVTEHRYLSGHGCDDMVQWDYCCTDGNRAGQWTTIGVPSCWEMQGFGTLQYGYLYDPWYSGLWKDTQRQGKAARKQIQATLPPKATEHGLYRKTFLVEKELKDKCVLLTFEGVMTDALVKVNGAEKTGPEGKPRHVAGRHHGCVILEKINKELRNSTLYVSSAGQVSSQRQSLYQSFLTPPDSIRVGCYYYWVNEHVDPKGVKADLQWMKDNGITLAFLATDIRNRTRWENPWEGETFGKNKFQSKLWWKNLHTALKTAGKLGIEMGIFNCPGWSQSGGPWIKPVEAMRNWTPQGIEICKTKQGTDVSCGPCSDEAEGLEVDKLSKKHVQKHFEAFIGEILRRIPQKDRPTLTTVVVDSWERGKQNYTDSIFVKFKQRFGYELDYQNEACRKDLDRLISDLVASEYMGGLTEKAHEYGLRTWCEPYAHSPFPGNSITYGSAADEVAAEFWVNDRKYRQKEVDAAIGAARRSGKNRVWAESFTDGTWDKVAQDDWSFEKLKPIADRYFHAGINASILHVVISQPGDDRKPAVRPWFGSFFDRRSQHATDLKPLVRYLRRCNFMLQLGKPYNNATDQRIMDDGTIICFTDDSQFEITFPDGSKETWNPCR